MNSMIETVGAYAGLVSLLAVLVLSLLVFSQARDLRRLREWAGGAPERDAEVRELSELVAEERSQELQVLADREQRRLERGDSGGDGFWARLGRPGRVMAVIALVVVVGAAGAWAGTTLLGSDDDSSRAAKLRQAKIRQKRAANQGAAATGLKPEEIKVGVLNGTGGTEVGLAAEYANRLEQDGYVLGAVTDLPAEPFSSSVVMYLKGNEEAAEQVGRSIDVSETELMTSEVSELTPGAVATAVIGTDHTALPAGG